MSAVPLIDIHTHSRECSVAGVQIFNAGWQECEVAIARNCWLSVGLHPWDSADASVERMALNLRCMAAHDRVLAIGECGLDRTIEVPLTLQESVFAAHLGIAEEASKPTIVHCVRAFDRLIALCKAYPRVPAVVVHGFNNKPVLANQLIAAGLYLSFGKALLYPESNASRTLVECPRERIFLETDDSGERIERIYEAAAERLGESLASLSSQIWTNFKRVFGGA